MITLICHSYCTKLKSGGRWIKIKRLKYLGDGAEVDEELLRGLHEELLVHQVLQKILSVRDKQPEEGRICEAEDHIERA